MIAETAPGRTGEDTTEREHRDAFERLWQRQRPRIWRLVARLAGSVDVADDLAQEVSVRAFKAFGTFRGEAKIDTWLYRIAINVAHRYHEQQRRRAALPLQGAEVASLAADAATEPEAAVIAADLMPAVWSALGRLSEELRTPLILHVYEGLRYREIAGILNIPQGTVMSRLHKARRLLREELKDYAM